MPLLVREETPADVEAIHHVNASAFETDAEALLVDALRESGGLTLSLVAELDGQVVGHVAFSPVVVTRSDGTTVDGMGLAPMSVLPGHQRQGIGAQLIAGGIKRLRASGHRFCVVLGHSEYYPRQGFMRAVDHGIRWEHPGTEDSFFVRELTVDGLRGVSGVVRYRGEFEGV